MPIKKKIVRMFIKQKDERVPVRKKGEKNSENRRGRNGGSLKEGRKDDSSILDERTRIQKRWKGANKNKGVTRLVLTKDGRTPSNQNTKGRQSKFSAVK